MEIEKKQLEEIVAKNPGRFGDRHCDLTVIGDKAQVNQFTDKLTSCFLTDDEIGLWKAGHKFEDPWPKNIVTMSN